MLLAWLGANGVAGGDEDIAGLRQSISTCAWRGVMRVTRASTPDVTSGCRGGARSIVDDDEDVDVDVGVSEWSDGLIISEEDDNPIPVDEEEVASPDAGSLVPIGSTEMINFEASWLFCAFVFPSFTFIFF